MPKSPKERQRDGITDRVPRPFFAKIASAPATVEEKVYVKIPTFDGGFTQDGPCRWEPRVGGGFMVLTPQVDDEALVIYDEDDDLWVIAWWPYG